MSVLEIIGEKMSDKLEKISRIQDTIKQTMEEPPAHIKTKIAELIAIYPRIAYPYMAESEFQAMMEAREKKQ